MNTGVSPPSFVGFRSNLVGVLVGALSNTGSLASPLRPLAAEKNGIFQIEAKIEPCRVKCYLS